MSQQLIIKLLNDKIQQDESQIDKYQICLIISTGNGTTFFEKLIIFYKLQIMLCKAILKNNKDLYKPLQDKIQEKLTELLELTSNDCAAGLIPEDEYLSLSNDFMDRFNSLKKLIRLCKNTDLPV